MSELLASANDADLLLEGDIDRLRLLADTMPHLVWYADAAGRIEYVNRRWVEYTGFTLEMMRPSVVKGIVHPDERERVLAAWFATIREGRPYEVEYRLRRNADGSYRWFVARARPVRGADGTIRGWVGTATDIDEQQRTREALEFLLAAQEAFATAADLATVFDAFARVAVTRFADWCLVLRAAEPPERTVLAAAHHDATAADAVRELARGVPPTGWALLFERLRAGAILVPSFSDEQLARLESEVDDPQALRGLGPRSAIVAPLADERGAVSGAIVLVAAESGRAFTDADLTVAERVAVRATTALETIEHLERAQRQSEQLRRIELATQSAFAATSVDLVETARRIARACTPEIADRATVYFKENAEHVRLLAVYDVDERMIESAYALRETYPLAINEPIREVLATGRPRLLADIDETAIEGISRDAGYRRLLRALALRSSLIVPLRAARGGNAVGALVLSLCRDNPRRYNARDIPLAEEVAARVALALETAARHDREHRVSQTFQRASLPTDLPKIPGTFLSAWYEAGSTEALVGGDWYDAFRLLDGRLVLSIGDVAGSGLDAAVIMGSVRQSIRTAAIINPSPRLALDAVDRVVRALGERYVTAFVAIFDPLLGELHYASAGHAPPLLRTADGAIDALAGGNGLPLGLRNLASGEAALHVLSPGSQLLLYTDGLTESERNISEGELRLRDALAVGGVTARRLFERAMAGREARDDVAMLLLNFERPLFEVESTQRAVRWRFATASARAGTAIRRKARRYLAAYGLGDHELGQAEIVIGELIGNAVRYASGIVDVFVDTSTVQPVVHVLDEGPGWELNPRLPADLMSERGRGLFIVNALSEELSISRRAGNRGSHARVVLQTARDR